MNARCLTTVIFVTCTACGANPQSSAMVPRAHAVGAVKDYIATTLAQLIGTVENLQSSAPAPKSDGWQSPRDDVSMGAMQHHWRVARVHYERIEGAIAVLFSHLDRAVDGRYENFIGEAGVADGCNGAPGDCNLFNGKGFTGMHAVERILWSSTTPQAVVDHERAMLLHVGYQPARFPANAQEATDFRDGLVAQLLTDLRTMENEFGPQALDLPAAYNGVVGSMKEQREKLNYANTGEDESRYAQHTLADMRANLQGGRAIYSLFQPLLRDHPNGATLDGEISDHFDALAHVYSLHTGDNVPPVPPTWNMRAPSRADLATEFGALWERVFFESNENEATSLVTLMQQGGDVLGLYE